MKEKPAVADAATYALPTFFDGLRGLSPLTPAFDGVRQIVTAGWGAVALVASAATPSP